MERLGLPRATRSYILPPTPIPLAHQTLERLATILASDFTTGDRFNRAMSPASVDDFKGLRTSTSETCSDGCHPWTNRPLRLPTSLFLPTTTLKRLEYIMHTCLRLGTPKSSGTTCTVNHLGRFCRPFPQHFPRHALILAPNDSKFSASLGFIPFLQ